MLDRFAASVVLAVILTSTTAASPPPLKSLTETRKLADSVMELVAADKIDEAVSKLKPYWPIPANEIDTLVLKSISTRNAVADRFGKIRGYTFVQEDLIGDFLVRYTYVEKREHHPLRWVFYFYRSDVDWFLDGASWDDQVQALFAK